MTSQNIPHPEAATTRQPAPASVMNLLVAAFGTLMLATAGGALWLLLCLSAPRLHAQAWPALLMAVPVGLLVRGWMIDARWHAAWLAAAAMLVSATYMRMLLMASDLAGSFGMGFIQAARHAGASMLVHLAWLSLKPLDIGLYIASALVAGAVAWLHGRSRR